MGWGVCLCIEIMILLKVKCEDDEKKYIFLKYYIKSKLQEKNATPDNIRRYLKDKVVVAKERTHTSEEINNYIRDMIMSGKPF